MSVADADEKAITVPSDAESREEIATAKLQRLQETLTTLKARRRQLSEDVMTAARPADLTTDCVLTEALSVAKKTNQKHIRLLNQYNEMKDVATSLLGMIAEHRQKRIVEVMQDFDVDDDD